MAKNRLMLHVASGSGAAAEHTDGESRSNALHSRGGAAECVRSLIPGALSILKGAVPGRARGLGHMAPTYFRREPGIATPAAIAAPHLHSTLAPDAGRAPDQPGTV